MKIKNSLFWAVCVLIVLIVCSVCNANVTVKITDMAGRTVNAPLDPERIICLGPGALRLIIYLEAENKVVGVENMEIINPGGRPYWIAHPELARLPVCGPGGPAAINKKPDLEAVLSVNPQVIIVTYMDGHLADEVEQILGIPVVVLSYGTFATFDEAVYDAIRIAGKLLNRKKRALDIIDYIESHRKDLKARTEMVSEADKPTAYIGGIGYRGAYGIESTEQKYIPFDWVNVINAAKQVNASIGTHVFIDKETLLKLNPDVIFVDGGGLELVSQDYRKKPEFYHALKAFSLRRVYTLLPFNFYITNIGTAMADAYAIGKIIYGESFKDVDPERKAEKIYTFLVGKPVYQAMKKDYGTIGGVAPFFK
jgi:iron complex transport system substrate-binding protein